MRTKGLVTNKNHNLLPLKHELGVLKTRNEEHLESLCDTIDEAVPKMKFVILYKLIETAASRSFVKFRPGFYCECCTEEQSQPQVVLPEQGIPISIPISITRIIMEHEVEKMIDRPFYQTHVSAAYLKILETLWKDLIHTLQAKIYNSIPENCLPIVSDLNIISSLHIVNPEQLDSQSPGEIPFESFVSVTMKVILSMERACDYHVLA